MLEKTQQPMFLNMPIEITEIKDYMKRKNTVQHHFTRFNYVIKDLLETRHN